MSPTSLHDPLAQPSGSSHNGSSTAVEASEMANTAAGMEDPASSAAVARHSVASTFASMDATESQMRGRLPRASPQNDPYGLAQRYKTATELDEIKANTSRKRDSPHGSPNVPLFSLSPEATSPASPAGASAGYAAKNSYGIGTGIRSRLVGRFMPEFGRKQVQAQRVRGFYESQNETIERLLKSVEEHVAEARKEAGDDEIKVKIAVWGSLVANVILATLQIYGAVSSGSLSLFTTMADAIFDPASNLTLIVTNRAVRRVDPRKFPSGKARLETVGNIVFCFLMTAVSMILIAFSIRELAKDSPAPGGVNSFHLPSVIAVAAAFVTKLALFLYTWPLKDSYSQVMILWQDHRNDLVVNGFGILTSVGGSKLAWWLDPSGAIVLSILVATIWLRTAFAEFMLLVGVVAGVEIQQLITYVCVTHSDAVRQIDTVRVYHSGPRLIAEVDIVMHPDDSLQATHDVAEELQFKLESLPDIERAYVHVDYETTHKPEHAWKKDL